MPKPKRRPKNAAVEEAGEAHRIVLSMAAGGRVVRDDRGPSHSAVGAADAASPGAKTRKTKNNERVSRPSPREPQSQSLPTSGSRELPATKRGTSAATIAVVACCGGIMGSLATIGAAKYFPLALAPSAIANGDVVRRVAHIDSELAALKASIATSATKDAARGEEQSGSLPETGAKAGSDTTGPNPEATSAPISTASPATDSVVDGWVLRNVSGGSALVEGRPGLIQVMPGDSLPGVGRVETIKREDGRWVVVTSGGLIVSR